MAILGPSGSGKTTLMNIIGCMDVADSGNYYLNGEPIHEMPQDRLNEIRNREIGFIFQNYQLIPTYNILQNIIMPLVVRGMTNFWEFRTGSHISRTNFPAVRNNGFPSHGRWRASRPFCSLTSLPERWIPPAAGTC